MFLLRTFRFRIIQFLDYFQNIAQPQLAYLCLYVSEVANIAMVITEIRMTDKFCIFKKRGFYFRASVVTLKPYKSLKKKEYLKNIFKPKTKISKGIEGGQN